MSLTVARAGFLTIVQDLGRTGWREHGVTIGGALDPHALRVANVLVGNEDGAAGLEITLGEIKLDCGDERVIAWCGGAFDVWIGEERVSAGHAAIVRAGEKLIIKAPDPASRAWLAISGGIDVPFVLGSRATDLRGTFGGWQGRALRDGDVLPLGSAPVVSQQIARALQNQRVSTWTPQAGWVQPGGEHAFLRIIRGAGWSRFPASAQAALVREPFIVSPESNRMGARLTGQLLEQSAREDLISEAVAPGTIQVPPDGSPILLLNDCQTIGGYPKMAHVISVDLSRAAALRASDTVRFREVTIADALTLLAAREEEFARFRLGIGMHVE
jgi:antagonist of KipI